MQNKPKPKYASALRQELEYSYLCSLIVSIGNDQELLRDCLDICPVECVITPEAEPYYRAIAEVYALGKKVDLVSIFHHMMDKHGKDQKNQRPVPMELGAMADQVISTWGGAREHASRIFDLHRVYTLQEKFSELAVEASAMGASPDDLAARARAIADSVIGIQEAPTLKSSMEKVMQRVKTGDLGSLMPLHWQSLNRQLRGGFLGQELIILAGRPGTGKTAFAGNIAIETARGGQGVLFVSREMGEESLAARFLARESRVDNRFYREGLAHGETINQLERGAYRLSELPLSIVEKSRGLFTPREVRRLARGVKDLGLIVIDYLQLMAPDVPSKSREQDVAAMSREFKTMAMDLKVPVLLLSQLNRGSEQSDREPQVSDLRESGAIEQDADIIMLLHTKKMDRSSVKPQVKCIIGKSRSTATGAVHFDFEKEFSNFVEAKEWTGHHEQNSRL